MAKESIGPRDGRAWARLWSTRNGRGHFAPSACKTQSDSLHELGSMRSGEAFRFLGHAKLAAWPYLLDGLHRSRSPCRGVEGDKAPRPISISQKTGERPRFSAATIK